MQNVHLELMWEANETFYFAYANGWSYLQQLNGWHPFVETTHLLEFRGRSVRAYLDREEMNRAGKEALKNFIYQDWVDRFEQHSRALLNECDVFRDDCHLRSVDIDKEVLVERIRKGTDLLYESLLTFMVTQPQYSAEVEPYLYSLLGDLPRDITSHIIATLAQSHEPSLITKEETAWAHLVQSLKQTADSVPHLQGTLEAILDEHARIFGLVCAADGQDPWNRETLYRRLQSDWVRTDMVLNRDDQLTEEQQELIRQHSVSDEVVRICKSLAVLSHLRLETRLRGWMALEYVVVKELIPELSKHLSYTPTQLESCTPTELLCLMEGKPGPSPEALEERARYVVAGVYQGHEVLWNEEEAREKFLPLLPVIDYEVKELVGQSAMRGKVTGPCHVIAWDVDVSAEQMEAMPVGAILVAGQTRPQLMPAIKKASAIITDEGGVLSHAAIVSRELRIPCIIGTKYATKILKSGDMVEVDAEKGIVTILKHV